jgi:hypothetical protein
MGTEGVKEIVRVASAPFTIDELTHVQLLRGEATKLILFEKLTMLDPFEMIENL